MKYSTKFNEAQHITEINPVEGFPGLHYVDVADEYEDPNTKEPYSYGVDENGENDGSCRIVLVNVAMSKSELRRHMNRLVSFMVAEGSTEKEAVREVIRDVNHARNISQRRRFVSTTTAEKVVAKATKKALAAGVSQEDIQAAVAQLMAEQQPKPANQ